MDSLMQMQDNKDEIYALISEQRKAMDVQTVNDIMHKDAFSIERLEAENLEGRMGLRQSVMLSDYRFNSIRYNRELRDLEKRKNTAEGMTAYFEKMIQIEQNNMEMLLLRASVLGRGTAAKRIRAESLEKIGTYRRVLLEQYYKLAQKGQQIERWSELAAAYKEGEAERQRVSAELNVRLLTTAVLDRIKTEREPAEGTDSKDTATLMGEFLNADFSTKTLEAGYVIQNLDACLHNVELIRRMRRTVFAGSKAAKVTRKLAAVREYPNVVESALWEYGLTIDYDALQIKEIDQNDEAFARRKRAYLENGIMRFYLDARRYKQSGGDGAKGADAHRQGGEPTSVEEKLSALEAKLRIADIGGQEQHIMKASTRSVGSTSTAKVGDVIRASEEEAQGRGHYKQVKNRILEIYKKLKERLAAKNVTGVTEFESLQPLLEAYKDTNRDIYEDRTAAEKKEANVLKALQSALAKIQRNVRNRSSKYAAILLGLLTGESRGYLKVPPGEIHIVEDTNIVLKDKNISGANYKLRYGDCKDMPLFTHRPNIKDVAQGGLGDCYLLAGLLSVVDQNAEEIMNIMKDNGDGTVTVCFKREETDTAGNKVYTPVYTTVRKTVPVYEVGGADAFSRGALWVKMIEKAYTASGLHILNRVNDENTRLGKPKQTYRELQEEIVKGKRKVDYEDIAGGFAGDFVSLLIGKKKDSHLLDKNRAEHVGERIGRMLPAVNEPGWSASPARKFGDESVDSIVYEYIRKQDQRKAQRFLSLEKPQALDRKNDALMASYRAERDALQKFRRTCILNLDIVDSIAREMREDILKLDSRKKIKRWYKKLKAMFVHFYNNAAGPLNSDDEILSRVFKNYNTPDAAALFLPITVQQFNATLNILQERHLALLRRNQQGNPGGAGGNAAQKQQSYYSRRDLKLFDRIEDALRSGSYVAFGTRILSAKGTGLNGESEAGGMVGTHAYTIKNTRKVMVDGELRRYVVVTNPWAEQGVVYGVDAGGTRERAIRGKGEGEKEEGVFCLDLKRFAEIVKQWDVVPA